MMAEKEEKHTATVGQDRDGHSESIVGNSSESVVSSSGESGFFATTCL